MIPSESNSAVTDGDRVVAAARDEDGEPLGACLYLSPSDLRALGLDVDEVDELVFSIDEQAETLDLEEVSE